MLPDRIGRYEVRGVAGSGGFATVYEGLDPRLDARVAIKVLADIWSRDPEIVRRFRREAVLLRRMRIEHGVPGLIEVFDIDTTDAGQPFFVMGWADRGTLKDRAAARAWPFAAVRPVISSLTQTLGHLHARGVIHRDIKPANVMVRSEGGLLPEGGVLLAPTERLLVGDLGLAKDFANDASALSFVAGTERYMPPEQLRFGGSIDHRADIFAASVMVEELLRGRAEHELSPALADALAVGRSSDPDHRYESMAAWEAALVAAAESASPAGSVQVPALGESTERNESAATPTPSSSAGDESAATPTPSSSAGDESAATPTPSASTAAPGHSVPTEWTMPGTSHGPSGRDVLAATPSQGRDVLAATPSRGERGWSRIAAVLVGLVALTAGFVGLRSLGADGGPEIVGPEVIESGTTATYRLADAVDGLIVWTDPSGQRIEAAELEISGRLPGQLSFSVRADGETSERTVAVERSPEGPTIVGPDTVATGDQGLYTAAVAAGESFFWIHPTRGQVVADEVSVTQNGERFVIGLIAVDADGVERGDQLIVEAE